MASFALVRVGGSRRDEQGDERAAAERLARRIISRLDVYLPTAQLGISLASLGLGWLGTPALAAAIRSLLASWWQVSTRWLSVVAAGIAFMVVAFLHVTLGELVPRSVATHRPERTVRNTARLLHTFYCIGFPIVWLFRAAAEAVLRLFHLQAAPSAHVPASDEELRLLVSTSHEQGMLDATERDLLVNVFDFSERIAKEVMIPRQDIVCIFVGDTVRSIAETVARVGHTRYPLCASDKDHILGIVHVRDLVPIIGEAARTQTLDQTPDLRPVLREALLVPETMSVTQVLRELQRRRSHMAIVVDEYGGTSGLLTTEDIVEEIVGEIYDEFDTEPPKIQDLGKGSYELDGGLLIEDVEQLLHVPLRDPDVETVAGLVFNRLGRKPKRGDSVLLEGFRFHVLDVRGPRIVRLRVDPLAVNSSTSSVATPSSASSTAASGTDGTQRPEHS